MTKAELVTTVAEKAKISKKDAAAAIDAFCGAVKDVLKNDDKISLLGFGTFSTGKRAARTGKNPQTGKEIKIAAATVAKFKPGKGLKDAINPATKGCKKK